MFGQGMLGKETDNDPTIWAQPIIIFDLQAPGPQLKKIKMLEKNKQTNNRKRTRTGL